MDSLHVTSSVIIPGLLTDDLTTQRLSQSLAGQTVPITIKNQGGTKFAYGHSGAHTSNKYGTLPHHFGGGKL